MRFCQLTLGELGDLEMSIKRFCLLQLSYNSGTTGPISMKVTPLDSQAAVCDFTSRFEYGDLG